MSVSPNYPDTVHFQGLNRPTHIEGTAHDLYVEGEIPAEIDGIFFRAVPDPAYVPTRTDDVILSADGAINKIEFRGGRVSYGLKYVRTHRFLAEQRAGKALFGRYRNPFTDDPSVKGVDRTVANTTPIYHGGRLFMTKEDGLPYRMDPETLDTIGRWDFGGALRSETFTAHTKLDAATGELFFFGYEASGLATTTLAYGIVSPEGELVKEEWFDAPYCSFMHDFAITETHAIFPVFPTIADLEGMKRGGPHWIHHQDRESWIGIMPRYGDPKEMVWIKGPVGVHAYHVMNAFAEGSLVHLDMCLANTNLIPFVTQDSGIDLPLEGGLTRWTMDLSDPEAGVREWRIGPFGEMPRIADDDMGKSYGRGWYLTIDPSLGKPLHNGPAGVGFNKLVRVTFPEGKLEFLSIGAARAINEPVHVPALDPAHGGWLLAVIDEEVAPGHYNQEVWIIEADAIGKGPIAKVKLPFATREQVHGNWVGRAGLEKTRKD
ncbi:MULTISPECIES: carotenoid oxygenase family protein [unclassified Novosphingobium]|uniref:carotenoid oxygenase family protein n=1 Tax=unclassified Novosphingobium TaxID=2644732 RepID=UPI00086A191E|nr:MULTISPECIES: carotenoid oxygenase family protein [unclassified Novosphingobium]MBN9142338.1 carotenoid oxygenase family protein [Novosphingobium sp.]ODU77629.1 MAG: carotenoid oxygenase [Novosphingobium sp. SCN 63-17]OJX90148.1 MAG: carotenoid oxygenase [Novosphingobium sp. 63-713]